MVIRIFAAICVALAGIFILYLPSTNPPERFLDQLRVEHDLNITFWGEGHAVRVLDRMLNMQSDLQKSGLAPPSSATPPSANPMDAALAMQVSQMTERMFKNQYFESIKTLLVLASYRFAEFIEWLPVMSIFILAAWFDGSIRRIVKGKEFLQHNPEIFGLCTCLVILILCSTVVAFVVPLTLHPLVLASIPATVGILGNVAIANFHYKG